MALISVITPVYFKDDPYFGQCLSSLAEQTFRDHELIIVDDASPCAIEPIVEHFRNRIPQLTIVRHTQNFGTLRSRFTGIDAAQGEYIAFLDADDTARPHFLHRLHQAITATRVDVISSSRNRTKRADGLFSGTHDMLAGYASRSIENHNAWTRLYRASLLRSLQELKEEAKTHRFDGPEDLVLNLFCARKGHSLLQIDDVLVNYTEHQGSVTKPVGLPQVEKLLRYRLNTIILLKKYFGPDFFPYIDIIFQRSVSYLYRSVLERIGEADLKEQLAKVESYDGGHLIMRYLAMAADNRRRELDGKLSRRFINLRAINKRKR